MGRQVGPHPATIIVPFLVTGALMGAAGPLPVVPAAVVVTTLADQLSVKNPLGKAGGG